MIKRYSRLIDVPAARLRRLIVLVLVLIPCRVFALGYDFYIVGELAPDATGGYTFAGVHKDNPFYTNGPYKLWRSGKWRLSVNLGDSNNYWANPANGENGDYAASGTFTGTATVSDIPPGSLSPVLYLKLNDNIATSTLFDRRNGVYTGGIHPSLNVDSKTAHIDDGLVGGAIRFNNVYPAATRYANLNGTFKTFFDSNYAVSYLCRSSDFRGSVLAAYSTQAGTSIDIAALSHSMGYKVGNKTHTFVLKAEVPKRFAGKWCLFTHTVEQIGTTVRVRLLLNGKAYVDQTVDDFNLSQWGNSSTGKYANLFLAAYNETQNGRNGKPTEGFPCDLDEVRFYKGILSDANIADLCEEYGLLYEGGKSNSENMIKK